jgi:hypothetical protein
MSEVALAPGETLTVTPKGGWLWTARFWHLIVALVGTASFAVSSYLAMTNAGNGGALNGLIFSLSYFTVLSNVLIAITNWILFVKPDFDGKIFRWYRMTTLVMIVITGLVYDFVLAADAHPLGIERYTTIGYHYIVPWATLLGFLLFGPRPRFKLRHVFEMLVIPVIWLIYTLIRGTFLTTPPASPPETVLGQPTNWYPYPFLDVSDPSPLLPGVNATGYTGVGINIGVIVILGIAFAFIFLGIDRWFSGGKKPTPLSKKARREAEAAAAADASAAPVAAAAAAAVVAAEPASEPPPPVAPVAQEAAPKEEPKDDKSSDGDKSTDDSKESKQEEKTEPADQEPPPAVVEPEPVVAAAAAAAVATEVAADPEPEPAAKEDSPANQESAPKEKKQESVGDQGQPASDEPAAEPAPEPEAGSESASPGVDAAGEHGGTQAGTGDGDPGQVPVEGEAEAVATPGEAAGDLAPDPESTPNSGSADSAPGAGQDQPGTESKPPTN